jgi:hypothetical protein
MSKLLLKYLLCGLLAIALSENIHPQQIQDTNSTAKQQAVANIRLMRLSREEDGLHKAALANGGSYVLRIPGTRWNVAATVADLVSESKLIAIVNVSSEETRLINDGRGIGTFYKFSVISVLEGDATNLASSMIELPGGTYVYDDRSIAAIDVERRPRMRVGHTYVIFLKPSATSSNILEPTFESQGIFEVSDDGATVRHYSMESGDTISGQYNGQPKEKLLSDVMNVLSKDK